MDKELENYQEIDKNVKVSFEKKKQYSKPSITSLGSMQKITLGGSTANPDSGVGPGPESSGF